MLTIIVPGEEYYDEATSMFMTVGDVALQLEHSLVSLSKWESKFEKPFLGAGEKTNDEVLAYIDAMLLTEEIPPGVFAKLSDENMDEINTYLNAKQTATYFVSETNTPRTSEQITSELIYYWMVAFRIPWEAQHWHLNRLFTLIRVCNLKQEKPKKQNRAQMFADRRALNAQRKAQFNTSG